jgi:hypothetical protein
MESEHRLVAAVRQAVSLTRMREGAILTPLQHHANE